MNYIDEIFSRVDLQHLREFFLYGSPAIEITDQDYRERLDAAQTPAIDMIHKAYPGDPDSPEMDLFYESLSVSQDVYMEIGMRAGAILMAQLLSKN